MKTYYLVKCKNTFNHVKNGKGNVWCASTKKEKLINAGGKSNNIQEFNRMNDLLCSIHGSNLPLIELSKY